MTESSVHSVAADFTTLTQLNTTELADRLAAFDGVQATQHAQRLTDTAEGRALALQLVDTAEGRALARQVAGTAEGLVLALRLAGTTAGRALALQLANTTEGRALAQQLVDTTAGRILALQLANTTEGRALAQQLASTAAGRALAQQLVDTTEGRVLALQLANAAAGLDLARRLAGTAEGRALALQLADTAEGRALAQQLTNTTAGRALAQQLAGTTAGRALAQQLTNTTAGWALARRLAGTTEGRALAQQLAGTTAGRALAQQLVDTAEGWALAQQLAGTTEGRALAQQLTNTDDSEVALLVAGAVVLALWLSATIVGSHLIMAGVIAGITTAVSLLGIEVGDGETKQDGGPSDRSGAQSIAEAVAGNEPQLVEQLGRIASGQLKGQIEPFLGYVQNLIHDGVLADNPILEQQVTTSQAHIQALFLGGDDGQVDMLALLPATQWLIGATAPYFPQDGSGAEIGTSLAHRPDESPDFVTAVADAEVVASGLSPSEIELPEATTIYEWLAARLSWRHMAAGGAIGATADVAGIIQGLGIGGPWAVLIGAVIGLIGAAWAPKSGDSNH